MAATTQVEIHESFQSLRIEWDELADRAGAPPFLRPDWIEAWWRAFAKGRLTVLATRAGGDLTGVLPLMRRAGGLVSPTNWHTPLFGPVCADHDAEVALAEAFVQRGGAHLGLRFIDAGDPFLDTLRSAATGAGWSTIERPLQRSPYVPIDGSWEQFCSGLSKDRRRSIRRRERRLRELGELQVIVEDGTERLDELLAEGFALEASGWKGAQGTAITSRPETHAFYTEIARWGASAGLLRLVFIRVDARPIAFNLCLEDDRVHYALKPGHSDEMARYGPGALLAYRMIERAFALDLASYELLGGEDEFKRSFAGEHSRAKVELNGFAGSPRGAMMRLVDTRFRPLARRILASPE
jgi:CelD/BcsL family acetyltransferase involved in cellulose biosynthesis